MKLEFLMEYTITLTFPPSDTPVGPFGNRRIYIFTGGSFEGPKLKGKILPSGGDWYLRDANGIGHVDYRAVDIFPSNTIKYRIRAMRSN